MTEKLIEYYLENLTFYSLVTKKNGIFKNLIYWLISLFSGGISIYFLSKEQYMFGILCLMLFLFSLFLIVYFNSMTIKKNYPDIYIKPFNWSKEKYRDLIISKLHDYLDSNHLTEKTDNIIEIIEKKAKNERLPFILFSSAFVALILPLWNSYINKVFDIYKSDIKEVTLIFLIFIPIVFIITVVVPLICTFRDTFFTRFYKLNKLIELLEDYKLSELK